MLLTKGAQKVATQIIWIASLDGRSLTPMQLIKLSYIAHGWTLAILDNPLFKDIVDAWRYGPVVPDIYHRYKKFGYSRISVRLRNLDDSFNNNEQAIMKRVVEVYGKYDGLYLSALTHQPDSPWDITIRKDGENTPIPNELIKEHYKNLSKK